MIDTDSHPVWTLCAETETLQPETNASLTRAFLVRLLVAFLLAMGYSGRINRDRGNGEEERRGDGIGVRLPLRG